MEITDQTSCRIDNKACAEDDQYIRICYGFYGAIEHILVESFFIENNIWFDDGSTMVTIWYARTVFDILCRK